MGGECRYVDPGGRQARQRLARCGEAGGLRRPPRAVGRASATDLAGGTPASRGGAVARGRRGHQASSTRHPEAQGGVGRRHRTPGRRTKRGAAASPSRVGADAARDAAVAGVAAAPAQAWRQLGCGSEQRRRRRQTGSPRARAAAGSGQGTAPSAPSTTTRQRRGRRRDPRAQQSLSAATSCARPHRPAARGCHSSRSARSTAALERGTIG